MVDPAHSISAARSRTSGRPEGKPSSRQPVRPSPPCSRRAPGTARRPPWARSSAAGSAQRRGTCAPTRRDAQRGQPLAHLAGRPVGERDGQPVPRACVPVCTAWAIRWVIARVLPVPAPASTTTGPVRASATRRCSGSRPSRTVADMAALCQPGPTARPRVGRLGPDARVVDRSGRSSPDLRGRCEMRIGRMSSWASALVMASGGMVPGIGTWPLTMGAWSSPHQRRRRGRGLALTHPAPSRPAAAAGPASSGGTPAPPRRSRRVQPSRRREGLPIREGRREGAGGGRPTSGTTRRGGVAVPEAHEVMGDREAPRQAHLT